MSSELTARQREAMLVLGSDAMHDLLEGGSRSGKTFLIIRAIVLRALAAHGSRHAILRFRLNAIVSSIVYDTFPKVMRLCFPGVPYEVNKKDLFARLPHESQIWFGGLDDKERVEKILGNEYATIFLNECSQIPYTSRNLAMTRLAQKCEYERDGQMHQLRLKAFYDYNPPSKGHWGYQLFHLKRDPDTGRSLKNPEAYASIKMNPQDNRANIAKEYLQHLEGLPPRLKARFYDGSYAEATPNALWTEEGLERSRVEGLPDLQRIAVAIDPSGASEESAGDHDQIGIVVVALGVDGVGYVLEDCTVSGGPERWGSVAVGAYDRHDADVIVAETNYGGDMVRAVVETAATKPEREGKRKPSFKKVTASRGKAVRAEPVSALFDTGKAKLAGEFRELETELCAFSTSGYTGEGSPNRADAMVWAYSELFPGMVRQQQVGPGPRVITSSPALTARHVSSQNMPRVVTRRH